jgi:hypothetical protein
LTEERAEVELRTVTLAEKDGLTEARRAKVTVIPTLILNRDGEELKRWLGRPALDELRAAVTGTTTRTAATA